jgi:hypothetical protein
MTTTNLADGYYWCSHDLGWCMPKGKSYPEQWSVVMLTGGNVGLVYGEETIRAEEVPDYVTFVGPLEPPK